MKLRTLFVTLSLLLLFSVLAFVRCSNQIQPAKLEQLNKDAFAQKLEASFQTYQQTHTPEKIYLHTDKPFYYPGEDIWFSGYLQGIASEQLSDVAYVEFLNPKGSEIGKLSLPVRNGKFHGDFKLIQGSEGGLYTIRAYTHWMKNASKKEYFFEKKLQVQKAIKPRLLLKLDFKREAYGPKDTVEAELKARDLQDRPIALQEVNYQVKLANKAYKTGNITTDGKGEAKIKFVLPAQLKNNDGILTVFVPHQQKRESITRSIPIVLGNITLDFFPEGGTWVADIEGQMAFKALNEFGTPADIEGVVEDERGREVTQFKSFHQGLGSFKLKPKDGEEYNVRITKPSGITKKYKLPAANADRYALGVEQLDRKKLKVKLYSHQPDTLYLVVQSGGKIRHSQKMLVQGKNTQTIPIADYPVGIAKITLFDATKKPQSERLVFINPHKQIKVAIKTAKKNYQPREKVTVDILTTNEVGKPVAANLSVAVVDDKVLSLADDKQDNILSYLLMSAELKGKVYEPNFYFKPDEPKATPALDFVMMTHGWRRYEWKDVAKVQVRPKFQKNKTNIIKGQVSQTRYDTVIPVKAIVSLYELEGKRRKLEVTTGIDGKFEFKNIDPTIPVQLFAQSVAHYSIPCKIMLANNLRLELSPIKLARMRAKLAQQEALRATRQAQRARLLAEQSSLRSTDYAIDTTRTTNLEDIIEIPVTEVPPPPKIQQPEVVEVPDEEEIVEEIQVLLDLELKDIDTRGDTIYVNQGFYRNVGDDSGILSLQYDGLQNVDLSSVAYKINGKVYTNLSRAKNFIPSQIISLNKLKEQSRNASPTVVVITKNKVVDYPNNQWNHSVDYLYLRQMTYSSVRIYRPKEYKTNEQSPEVRNDFRNTIYWNPEVVTNENGKATLTFWNNDALTTFRIIAEGVGANGNLGRTEQTYFTKLPFELTAKVPPYFSVNDVLKLPVYLTNNTGEEIRGELQVTIPGAIKLKAATQTISIAPQSTKTVYVEGTVLRTLAAKEDKQLAIKFKNARYSESFAQDIEIFSKGFPRADAYSGNKQSNEFKVSIPEMVDSTLKVELVAYPNILGDLMESIAAILQEPHGCFEQVSSSTYPNIMALQFMEKNQMTDPKFKARALEYIQSGYQQLAAYETSEKGFEWYGDTPPHEGLTAFGLMEFLAMKKVYSGVSDAMIARTKAWLLSRKDGKGGFKQNTGKYGFSGASKVVNNAYVLYALTEAGERNLNLEFKTVYQEVQKSQDTYRTALAALAAVNLGKTTEAELLLNNLRSQVSTLKPGKLKVDHSIVWSGGVSLQIETCALIALAEMRQAAPKIDRILPLINYIIAKRSGGYFGSTQGTILALQALTQYADLQANQAQNGQLMVYQGEQHIGTLAFSKSQLQAASLKGLGKYFKQGANDISIRFTNEKMAIPFTLNVRYYAITPKSSKACALALKTKLTSNQVLTQENVRLTTTIQNKRSEGLPSAVALIGIPSGLSVQPWQLKELQEQGKVAYYELRKSYVIFYFREMAPKAIHTINLDLKAEIPGTYRAPASTAYLYYTSEFKDWQEGTQITVKPAVVQ
ncbi:hypothetical protein BKI52_03915 [marine bacterium AO1-C]|nr:hypothetical protein BKI52_03915 [marine bacterium AO1-C]